MSDKPYTISATEADRLAEQIEELRKLEAAATPGPWHLMDKGFGRRSRNVPTLYATDDNLRYVAFFADINEWNTSDTDNLGNAKLMHAARNALPALLDAASRSARMAEQLAAQAERIDELELAQARCTIAAFDAIKRICDAAGAPKDEDCGGKCRKPLMPNVRVAWLAEQLARAEQRVKELEEEVVEYASDTFYEIAGHPNADGWYCTNARGTAIGAAETLVKLGRLEPRPDNSATSRVQWYRPVPPASTKDEAAPHVTPPPGRKMTFEESTKHINDKYAVDLKRLADGPPPAP